MKVFLLWCLEKNAVPRDYFKKKKRVWDYRKKIDVRTTFSSGRFPFQEVHVVMALFSPLHFFLLLKYEVIKWIDMVRRGPRNPCP